MFFESEFRGTGACYLCGFDSTSLWLVSPCAVVFARVFGLVLFGSGWFGSVRFCPAVSRVGWFGSPMLEKKCGCSGY